MTLPAIRPHQKTLLHLRDSATVDFGPAGQTLTNSGVTVNDDVFTFESGDYIDPGTPLVDADVDDWTIAAWIKTSQAAKGLIYHETPLSSASSLGVFFRFDDDGFLECFFNADGSGAYTSVVGTTDVRDAQWHFVTVRKIGTDVEMRLDFDTEVNTATADSSGFDWTSVDTGSIGDDRRTAQSSPVVGDMADLRVLGYGLTDGELFDLYNEGRNWVLQRRVDQAISIDPSTYAGSGDLLDRSGNGNDLTLPSGYTVSDGVVNTVDTTNGPDTGVSLDGIAGTISMWVKSTDTDVIGLYQSASRFALCWEDGGSGSTATGVSNVTLYVDGAEITDNRNTFHDAVADGTWHHVAMTGDFDAGWSTVHLFRAVSGSLWRMNGSFDKLLIADGVKYTAEQIAQIYALGREEDTGTAAYDLPERKQLPNTRLHLVDGLTDAGFYGQEVTSSGTSYRNGMFGIFSTTQVIETGYAESGEHTVSFWVKSTDTKGCIFSNNSTTGLWLFLYQTGSGGDAFSGVTVSQYYLDGVATSTPDRQTLQSQICDGGWHHVAVAANWDSNWASQQCIIGDYQGAGGFGMGGNLKDIKIRQGYATAGEILNDYRKGIPAIRQAEVLRIDPARYSGSGDLIDQTARGNDGTLTGSTTVTGDGTVSFLSSSGHLETGTTGLSKSAGTYAFWFKSPDASTVNDRMYFFDIATTRIVFLKDSGTGNSMTIQVDGRSNSETFPGWAADEWNHIAATWDTVADEFKIYFNGEQQGSAAGSGTLGSNSVTGTLVIGAAFDGSNTVLGEMDKIVVASEAYTADQIAFLASSREFADPFPQPFLNLGGESLNIQPSRYSGNGDLLDESGNGNDLTLPSGYSVADGVISSDGTADGPDSGVSFASQTASIGVWVKTTDTVFMIASSGASEYLGAAFNNNPAHHSGTSNATTYIDGETGSYNTQSQLLAALNDGQWHHFAFTADFNSSWGNAQFFDYNSSSSWRFTGETDDLRIETGRKWSAEEVKLLASSRGVELPNTRDAKLYVSPSYDDASDGSTTNVIDYSGNTGDSGQPELADPPTWTADTSPDNGRSSLVFVDSETEYIEISEKPIQGNATQLSVFFWMKPTDESTLRTIFSQHGSSGNRSLNLYLSSTGQIVLQTSSDGTALTSHSTTTLYDEVAEWLPICVTWDADADEATVWSDGVRDETFSGLVSSLHDTASPARIGVNGVGSSGFDGSLDDMLIFDRVLTPAEIAFFSDKRNPYGTPATPTEPSTSIPTSNQLTLLGCF